MFTMDINNNITLTPDRDLPNDSQTNIHSNNVRRHDSSPNNKHPQSVSHPKPGPTQDPLFFTNFTSQNKVFTQTGTEDALINTHYDLHCELLLVSVPRGWGGGGEVRWYSDGGMFVEMNRGGVLTYGKRR